MIKKKAASRIRLHYWSVKVALLYDKSATIGV